MSLVALVAPSRTLIPGPTSRYTLFVAEFTTIEQPADAGIVAITAFVLPSMTDKDCWVVPKFATYTRFVLGLTAMAQGASPPVLKLVVPSVAPSITVTSLLSLFAT